MLDPIPTIEPCFHRLAEWVTSEKTSARHQVVCTWTVLAQERSYEARVTKAAADPCQLVGESGGQQGLRFLRQALPDILAKRTDFLSPRMVSIIADLASAWRQLDERIEPVTDEIETLAKSDSSCFPRAAVGSKRIAHRRIDRLRESHNHVEFGIAHALESNPPRARACCVSHGYLGCRICRFR
jgi:hypothetical protein